LPKPVFVYMLHTILVLYPGYRANLDRLHTIKEWEGSSTLLGDMETACYSGEAHAHTSQ